MNERPAGDRAVLIELEDNEAAVALARSLAGRGDVVDVVPGHRTVLVTWAGAKPALDLEHVEVAAGARSREHRLAVTYDGPDLDDVARLTGLSQEEVVARHLAARYVVAFLGFAPGFGYLVGGDERLAVSRLDRPRERVPAGAVAIAGPYAGVYPRESPGGWRLLGRTDAILFDAGRETPALLAPGDRVRFVRT
jgi:KipI family sensor histidine kinase inhibitor